ncbi:spore germination protein GerPC [Polycladomyces subterraneus]|uniref:Spore germination protein GerPC n=1 Tax=Polycladomyces subterraneus TaxID=1016997 RepID=A0ABT8IQP9_9BACL|nr:spore germination protein GerPC [Polycladomyces subterraneus]MDN4595033.1 spore germination protein GerPC [Polycladomyces subterraneus]
MYAYLWDRINQLQQEIENLKEENEQIRKQLASIQPVTIERMEYKIQELRVETLSGTLNVGLSAHGDEQTLSKIIDQMKDNDNEDSVNMGDLEGSSSLKDDSIPVQMESSSPSTPSERSSQ